MPDERISLLLITEMIILSGIMLIISINCHFL